MCWGFRIFPLACNSGFVKASGGIVTLVAIVVIVATTLLWMDGFAFVGTGLGSPLPWGGGGRVGRMIPNLDMSQAEPAGPQVRQVSGCPCQGVCACVCVRLELLLSVIFHNHKLDKPNDAK